MNRASVAVVALLCAVVGMPQSASAAGSYGAVVEKGVRGCTDNPVSRIVVCFESPTVNSPSRGMLLPTWRAAHFYLGPWDTGPVTLRVRAVSKTTTLPSGSRPVLTYLAKADHVTPEMSCRDDFQFESSDGVVRLTSVVSACKP